MNDLTKALLKDLQEALDTIKTKSTDVEVAWELGKLAESMEQAKKLIVKEIN